MEHDLGAGAGGSGGVAGPEPAGGPGASTGPAGTGGAGPGGTGHADGGVPQAGPPAAPASEPSWAPPDVPGSGTVAWPSPPDGTRPRRRRVAVAVSVAVAVVVAGTGAGLLATGSAPTPAQAVLDAAIHTEHQRTADVTLSLSATGLPNGGDLTFTGTGQANLDTSAGSMVIVYGGTTTLNGVQMKELVIGGNAYIDLLPHGTDISSLLPGKHWIEMPLPEAGQASSGISFANPTAMLHTLAARGGTVAPLGPRSVRGRAATGYAVTLDKAAAVKLIRSSHLPAAEQRIATAGLDRTRRMVIDVWVSDGEVVRMSVTVSLSDRSGRSGRSGETVAVVADYSHFGTPVSITAPPAGQVVSFQRFLAAAKAAAGS